MSLSPQDLATQFDLYADANKHARYDTDWHNAKKEAYQHAARMVREFLIPPWAQGLPTDEGLYWHRIENSTAEPTVRRIVMMTTDNGAGRCLRVSMSDGHMAPL